VTFTLQEATAFFLWGAVNHDHEEKSIALTSKNGASRLTTINDTSSVLDFKQVLYWESGLDREDTYTIQI
ncbi:hypothetical protein K435DRAFT_620430, partial [Dendrothele bispora CBS 962.96]